jgi:hypothetical protein
VGSKTGYEYLQSRCSVIHAALYLMISRTRTKGFRVVNLFTADVITVGNLNSKLPLMFRVMRVKLRFSFNFRLYLRGKCMVVIMGARCSVVG